MATDKQKRNLSLYSRRLKEGREEYEKRKQYLASFRLPMPEEFEEEEEEKEEDKGADVEDPSGSIGNFSGSGELVAPAEYKQYRYTSGFAWRWGRQHYGVDLAPNSKGTLGVKILAAGDGVVTKAGSAIGFGQAIVIKHKDDLYTLYGHMPASSIQVKVGEIVKQGQFIATMGMEGGSTGVHLHFEVHTNYDKRYGGGATVNPENYVDCRSGATSVSNAPKAVGRKMVMLEEEHVEHDHNDSVMHAIYNSPPEPLTPEGKMVDLAYRTSYPYESVKFMGESIKNHYASRENFLIKRVGWARAAKYEKLVPLNKKRFIHQAHYDGYEGNLYSPDAKRLFESLLLKTKKPYFEVISGFRFSKEGQISPHEAGCAIDIQVRDIDEVREIADCAWQLGIRSIAMGGEFDKQKGFIHLDIAPKGKNFKHEGTPIYGGPGKWEIK